MADGTSREDAEDDYQPYVPVRLRRKEWIEKKLGLKRQHGGGDSSHSASPSPDIPAVKGAAAKRTGGAASTTAAAAGAGLRGKETLLQVRGRLVRNQEISEEDEIERQLRQEAEILRAIRNARALKSAAELAKGIRYDEPLRTSWRHPHHVAARSAELNDRLRNKMHIAVEGKG